MRARASERRCTHAHSRIHTTENSHTWLSAEVALSSALHMQPFSMEHTRRVYGLGVPWPYARNPEDDFLA
eukprot:3218365-Pleurochrysis_carterae.AAC.1